MSQLFEPHVPEVEEAAPSFIVKDSDGQGLVFSFEEFGKVLRMCFGLTCDVFDLRMKWVAVLSERYGNIPAVIEQSSLLSALRSIDFSPFPEDMEIKFDLAMRMLRKQVPVVVLISGTSGSGKSSLSRSLAYDLGFSCLISTDSVRQLLRGLPGADPALIGSTYDLDGIEGFNMQCKAVLDGMYRVVRAFISEKVPLVLEGVHLNRESVDALLEGLDVDAFVVHVLLKVKDEESHQARFAGRCPGRSTDPSENRYVRNIEDIRIIQEHLLETTRPDTVVIHNSSFDQSLEKIQKLIFDRLIAM